MVQQFISKNGKGQTAVEFFFLLVFVLFIVTILLVVLGDQLERQQDIRDQIVMERLASAWQQEIGLAASGPQSYERVFQFPLATAGHPIRTKFGSDENNISDEIAFQFRGKEYLNFLPTTVGYQELATDEHEVIPYRIRVLRECYDSQCKLWLSDANSANKKPPRFDTTQNRTIDISRAEGGTVRATYPYIVMPDVDEEEIVVYNTETDAEINMSFPSTRVADVDLVDDILFVSASNLSGTTSLILYNLSSEEKIQKVNETDASEFKGRKLVIDYPYVYHGSGDEFNISSYFFDGSEISYISSFYSDEDTIKEFMDMEKDGDLLYVYKVRTESSGFFSDLSVLNVSNPFNMTRKDKEQIGFMYTDSMVGSLSAPDSWNINIHGEYLYLTLDGTGPNKEGSQNSNRVRTIQYNKTSLEEVGEYEFNILDMSSHYAYSYNKDDRQIEAYTSQQGVINQSSSRTFELGPEFEEEDNVRIELFDNGFFITDSDFESSGSDSDFFLFE